MILSNQFISKNDENKYIWSSFRAFDQSGSGCLFSWQTEKAVLDVGDILVGSCQLIEIPLVNNSSCPISVHLSVEQKKTDVHSFYDSEEDQSGNYFSDLSVNIYILGAAFCTFVKMYLHCVHVLFLLNVK